VLLDSCNQLDSDIAEALKFLNIDEASDEYLDNIGALIGIARPARDISSIYLKSDDSLYTPDFAKYYVKDAKNEKAVRKVDDAYYRMLIHGQIIRNSTYCFSQDEMELFCQYVFSNDIFTSIDFEVENYTAYVTVNSELSQLGRAFLQQFSIDGKGRKIFDFPYPPYINTVVVRDS
jgi:hypothetical protein